MLAERKRRNLSMIIQKNADILEQNHVKVKRSFRKIQNALTCYQLKSFLVAYEKEYEISLIIYFFIILKMRSIHQL